MSNKSIKDLQLAFSPEVEEKKLKELVVAKDQLIEKLFKKIDELQNLDRSKVIKLNLTAEEEICEMQIQSMLQTSRVRDLTLEETKKLDLLIKNKRLYNNQPTVNTKHEVLPTETPVDELMEIASAKEKGSDSAGS